MRKIVRGVGMILKFIAILMALLVMGVILFYAMPLARCGLARNGLIQSGSSYRFIQSGGLKRCYLLYVPALYRPDQPAPVIFSLQGFMGDPYDLRGYARWEQYADQGGFLVVYPQGSSFPLRWNVGPGARIPEVDDVQFIQDLIGELSTLLTIDPQQIYVTGFSNGGEKANQTACALSDKVAAIGVVAALGPDYPGGCSPNRPMPVIAFFGTAEKYGAPLPSGLSLWFQDLIFNVSMEEVLPGPANPAEWSQAWATRNGCDPNPAQEIVSELVVRYRYSRCRENVEILIYMIEGMGHAWPGGQAIPIPGFGESTTEIDASAVMWEFFQKYTLTNSSK